MRLKNLKITKTFNPLALKSSYLIVLLQKNGKKDFFSYRSQKLLSNNVFLNHSTLNVMK